jgi:hypothetical protein
MMNELVDKVAQKTGLSPDQARGAIDTVLGFLKQRLPASVGECLDPLLSGTEGATQTEGDSLVSRATAAVGSLFGKDK